MPVRGYKQRNKAAAAADDLRRQLGLKRVMQSINGRVVSRWWRWWLEANEHKPPLSLWRQLVFPAKTATFVINW
jgi:hypothetical protein